MRDKKPKGYRKMNAAIAAGAAGAAAVLALAAFVGIRMATDAAGGADAFRIAASPVTNAPFRVAVLTVADDQDTDIIRGIERLYEIYGNSSEGGYISHSFFPDTFVNDPETATAAIERASEDPKVMAVVVAEGVPGTVRAFRNIRRARPEVKLFAAETHEDCRGVSEAADLALNADYISRGYTIPWAAKKMGAAGFIHVSFPRHMAMESFFRRRIIMEEAAHDLGLFFRHENAPDPTAEGGVREARAFIQSRMPLWLAAYGDKTAFFTTNNALTGPMISAIIERGGYFVEADEATPLLGFPEALDLGPKEMQASRDRLVKTIERKLVARGAGGRLGTWTASVMQSHLMAMVRMAILSASGTAEASDLQAVAGAYAMSSPGAAWNLSPSLDADGTERNNVILVYQDTYVFGRGPLGTAKLEIPAKYRRLAAGGRAIGAAGTAEPAQGPRPDGGAADADALRGPAGSKPRARAGGTAGEKPAGGPGATVLVVTGSNRNTPQERQGAVEAVRARNSRRGGALAMHLVMPDDVWKDSASAADFIENAASDPALKVLVLAPAPRGAGTALFNLRARRPDLVLLAATPATTTPATSGGAHLTLVPDLRVRAALLPSLARHVGAEGLALVAGDPAKFRPDQLLFERILRKSAAQVGIPYALAGPEAYVPSSGPAPPDPLGPGTAIFTLRQDLAAGIIAKVAADRDSFYLGSPLSGPMVGFPEAFGLDLSHYAGEWPLALKRIEDEAASRGASGRLGTWSYPFRFASAAGLTDFGLLVADGEAGPEDFRALLVSLEQFTPGAGWNGTPYVEEDGDVIPGTLAVWEDTYVLGKGHFRTSRADLPQGFSGAWSVMRADVPAPPGARPRPGPESADVSDGP
ncbi:MAG: DUF3798 domain-containing protein [Deltaproteobacteria bacterium]|jgi:hypothetical protein|nr:DUF3798 domain-containing protein [Deltaproteobacteria bacterium]